MYKIFAIVDDDELYAKRLMSYINLTGKLKHKVVSYRNVDELLRDEKHVDIRQVLIDDKYLDELPIHLRQLSILLLQDEYADTSATRPGVYKYMSADDMIRDILKMSQDGESGNLHKITYTGAHITGVCSPLGRCGKSTLAITLGLMKSTSHKTILITLDAYRSLLRGRDDAEGLSDLIYAYKQGKLSSNRIESEVYNFGPLRYIPAVRYAEDIHECSSEGMTAIIRALMQEAEYEEVIIDMGAYADDSMELRELCDDIYMPCVDDAVSREKTERYLNQLRLTGREDIASKIVKVMLPYDRRYNECDLSETAYIQGPVTGYIRSMDENN